MTATHIRPLQTHLGETIFGGDLYKLDPPFGPEEDEYVRVEPISSTNDLYVIYPSNKEGECVTYDKLAKGSTVQEALFNLAGYRIK